MRPLLVLPALMLAVLAAGCTDPEAGPAAAGSQQTPGSVEVWQGTQCEQLHGIFSAPATDWGQPEGWVPSSPDAGATNRVFVYPTLCLEGSDAWVLVGITPPAPLADAEVDLEYWVITAAVSDPALRDALLAHGFPVEEGFAVPVATGPGESWGVEKETSSYRMHAATGAPMGDDFHVTQRFWTLGPDGPVALRMTVGHALDQGTGSVVFTANGDDGAPPVLPGIAHRITDLSFTYALETYPVAV